MGTNLKNADAASHPQHTVKLKAYRIDKYLVTNAQYARFVAATGHRPPSDWKNGKIQQGALLYPVTMVNWYDAAAYAKWAGKRLPTEAEWEKAARGTDGRRWPWGNEMDPARLNTYYNVGSATDVTTYANGVSPYGVYDMAGNVDEWVADDFLPYKGTDAAADVFQGKVARVLRCRRSSHESIRYGPGKPALQGVARRFMEGRSIFHGNLSSRLFLAEFCIGFLRISLCIRFGKINELTEVYDEPHLGENHPDTVRFCCSLVSSGAVDSYRFLHVTIETPWYIFIFLLMGVFVPFVLMAVLAWKNATRKSDREVCGCGPQTFYKVGIMLQI